MKGVESITHKGKVIAIIFRSTLSVAGVQFFTGVENFFQVGFHKQPEGLKLTPHIHRIVKPIRVTAIQEMLMVQKGKIRLTMYTSGGKRLTTKILRTGDSALLIDAGHGVDFLAETSMFEIKQGPYPGSKNAKIYLP